jgi:hypothetical protein
MTLAAVLYCTLYCHLLYVVLSSTVHCTTVHYSTTLGAVAAFMASQYGVRRLGSSCSAGSVQCTATRFSHTADTHTHMHSAERVDLSVTFGLLGGAVAPRFPALFPPSINTPSGLLPRLLLLHLLLLRHHGRRLAPQRGPSPPARTSAGPPAHRGPSRLPAGGHPGGRVAAVAPRPRGRPPRDVSSEKGFFWLRCSIFNCRSIRANEPAAAVPPEPATAVPPVTGTSGDTPPQSPPPVPQEPRLGSEANPIVID